MHKDSTAQAKQKKDEREEVLKEIRQLENRQKILENKQRNEERKARTRRLIERGAILEGIFPLTPDLPGIEVKAFLIALSHLPGAAELAAKLPKSGTSRKSLVYKGALIHRCRCRAPCRGLLRTSSAMGSYTPQTPCAPRAAKHPLRVCSAPRSLKYPRRKEVPPIDFCHIPVSIIKRSEGRSAVAAAAYRSGTKLTNEWDGLTHDYTRKGGVVHAEIMLPAHAPPEFADRSTLWNSVEQIEKARDSQLAREIEAALPRELSREQQLALVRAYVKDNFVDKGMCADFAIHDKGTGNPHVHIMLTVRPLKENGAWGAKCRKAYDLDENGQRIPDGKGGWKNHREDTTDWNDKGNVEIWRAAWAAYTNRALEAAGQPALVDHRSYKRQGIDKIPSVHLGPAASQMEKRGIRTDKGEVNRQIAADNKLLKEIKARITRLYNWSKAEAEKPEGQQPSMIDLWEAQQQLKRPDTRTGKIRALQENAALFSFLQANGIQSMQQLHDKISDMNSSYYDLRREIVKAERRIAVLTERGEMWAQYNEYKAVHKQLAKVKPEKRELFEQRHSRELILYDAAARYLKELKASGEEITPKEWRREIDLLAAQKQVDSIDMKAMREELKAVERLRKAADQLARQERDKSHDRGPER